MFGMNGTSEALSGEIDTRVPDAGALKQLREQMIRPKQTAAPQPD
jgi:hypothetical protein